MFFAVLFLRRHKLSGVTVDVFEDIFLAYCLLHITAKSKFMFIFSILVLPLSAVLKHLGESHHHTHNCYTTTVSIPPNSL